MLLNAGSTRGHFAPKPTASAPPKLFFLPIVLFESTTLLIPKYTCTSLHPRGWKISLPVFYPVHLHFLEVQLDFGNVQPYLEECTVVLFRIPRTSKEYNRDIEKYSCTFIEYDCTFVRQYIGKEKMQPSRAAIFGTTE
jgi:hypothetical protein